MKNEISYLENGDLKLSIEFDDINEKQDLMNEDTQDIEENLFTECLETFKVVTGKFGDLTDKFMITDVLNLEDLPITPFRKLIKSNVWFYNTVYNWFQDLVCDGSVIFTQRGRML